MNGTIVFDGVTKTYRRHEHLARGIKAALLNLPTTIRAFQGERFDAVRGVSFSIAKGETVGIVGRNGAGKSTVLGLIAGVLWPQAGKVEVLGRVAPLLELGAGFHPELTGVENIFLNAILLGLTRREVDARLRAIAEFSELGDFLRQPLRTYSSGMMARLGFSVACHLDPDILLVDEVLAVGDVGFQAKCRAKIQEFQGRGVTIVLVSHSGGTIRELCRRAIWIDGGVVKADGPAGEVLDGYEGALA
jgi:lipopolysaccharide transport system ATP-binding protein